MAKGPGLSMSKTTKKKIETKGPKQDTAYWLAKISKQLECLVLCHEKRLSGQVFPDFNSKQELKNKE